MDVVVRDGDVWMVRDAFNDEFVRVAGVGDLAVCKCCAFECESEVTINVTFCGVTSTFTVPIPGTEGISIDLDGEGEGGSYLIVGADINCGPCGWQLVITICGYCEETDLFVSEGYIAVIPFAPTAEDEDVLFFCPAGGEVDLVCFGEQFGIPCVTTTTASIA